MYADDTHINYAGSDFHPIQSSLSHDLEKLSKWLVSNKLTLNATKTEFILMGSRQRLSTLSDTLELSINKVPVEQVSPAKSLQWSKCQWKSNLAFPHQLCKKIASATGAINWVKVTPLKLFYYQTFFDMIYFIDMNIKKMQLKNWVTVLVNASAGS